MTTYNDVKISDIIIPKFYDLHKAIREHKYTHYRNKGGRASSKSSFISIEIPLLIKRNPNLNAVIMRKVANTLRDSVYAQIKWAISILNLENEFKCTVSPMEITYTPTNQKILFRGLDEPEKLKSIKSTIGYFGIIWFEEYSQYTPEEIRNVEQSFMRGGDKFYVFESYNPPITNSNWVNKDSLIDRPDRIVTESSYLDVPTDWLGEQFIFEADMLKLSNERAYLHEYMGIPTGTGGNVFENVVTESITDEQANSFDRVYRGLDFGWYPDPTFFVACHLETKTNTLYIFEELKRNKTSNAQMALLLEKHKKWLIMADSAEPKDIADFNATGFTMRGVTKGAGSVEYGIKWLQALSKIVIDPIRCPHTTTEFLEYEYERTKDGEILNAYPDKNNHGIDAIRYALSLVYRIGGK